MSHYFNNDPSLKSESISFEYYFCGEHFEFISDVGVFSKGHVDFGSYLLLEEIYQNGFQGRLLDLGCGFGVIGIILKKFHPDLVLEMVDVNQRAIKLTKENLKLNNIEANAYVCEDISKLEPFDNIVLNPPIHAGKKVIYDLYEKSYLALKNNSSLYIVIRKNHGAESTIKKLKTLFNEVMLLKKDSGYWIIKALKTEESVGKDGA